MRNVSIETIRAAATRIYPTAIRTPLVRLDSISRNDPEVWLKLESFQRIGSFKIRGAVNALAQLHGRPDPGRCLDGERRECRAGRCSGCARGGRSRLGAGHGGRAGGQALRDRAARRINRQRAFRRVLAHGRDPRVGPDDGQARPSVRRRRVHQRERDGGARDSRGLAGRRRGGRRDGRRGASRRHRLGDAGLAAGVSRLRRRTRQRRAARGVARCRARDTIRGLEPVVGRRGRRPVGARLHVADPVGRR